MRLRRAPIVAALVLLISLVAPVSAVGPPAFHLEPVVSGLSKPVFVASSPNRKFLYVVEQRGVVKVLRRDSEASPWALAGNFLDLRHLVTKPGGGRGMMGMVFHPKYARNGLFYVHYTRRSNDPANVGDIVIAEYRRRTNLRARPTGRTVLVIDHPTKWHTGGWMAFGPDRKLYVSIGDAAQTSLNNGQNLTNLQGKILRFNPRKSPGVEGFIPADNPFVGEEGDDLIWAYGLRHPWRASFDRSTGALWISDAGQNDWEEVTRFDPPTSGNGANLGWAMCEGSHAFPPLPDADPVPCDAPAVTGPTIEYGHEEGRCSVIGGYVYRGTASPALAGRYFYGDYCTGEIWSVSAHYELAQPIADPLVTGLHISSFGEDAAGEIYVMAIGGSLWRIVQD